MRNLNIWNDNNIKSRRTRILALFFILLLASAISLFAIELGVSMGDNAYGYIGHDMGYPTQDIGYYPSYQYNADIPSVEVDVYVDEYGYVNIQPYDIWYYIKDVDEGYALIQLPAFINMLDITVTIPYGWDYWVFDCYMWEYPYSPVVSVLLFDPSDYEPYQPINYIPTEIDDETDGVIAGAPTYEGVQPFSMGGRQVNIHGNGIAMGANQNIRFTLDNGTLGYRLYNILIPIRPGHAFMWFDTQPDGRGVRFTSSTIVPPGGIDIYLVWGFNVVFSGNGFTLPNPVPISPTNPLSFTTRVIPNGWSIAEAIASPKLFVPPMTGAPITFPNNPGRASFSFVAWYDIAIPDNDDTIPHPTGNRLDVNTVITGPRVFIARWTIPSTHLVRFDMNSAGAFLAPGTATQPQRLYRFALHHRSIADSGLGGDAYTGLGPPGGIAADEAPWIGQMEFPTEARRQNIQRPFIPNQPSGSFGHIDRFHPDFTTPYYPGSGLINPPGASLAANAGTAWPRSAPDVRHTNMWTAAPGAPGVAGALQQRYTLEGWWTQPTGWRNNAPGNIVSQRFVPAGWENTHTSSWMGITWDATIMHVPVGFPAGLALRIQAGTPNDVQDINNPPTGIVTEDMTLYANWVYRVTFDLNGVGAGAGDWGNQGFRLQGSSDFFPPQGSVIANYRDILPDAPVRTINAAGTRVRASRGFDGVTPMAAHQPIEAGMPPTPTRTHHIFNGWWDRPVGTIPFGTPGYATYPATNHGAVQFTGDTVINGTRRVWAHWLQVPPTPTPPPGTLVFHLNATPADIDTEGEYGLAYWPTHRPIGYDFDNPTGRFFLSRIGIPAFSIPGPSSREFNSRYTASDLAYANVHYDDRYSLTITRQFYLNYPIQHMTRHRAYERMPRNPRRTGYVFVGWHPDPEFEPLTFGAATPGIWSPNTVLTTANHPGTLYAIWAPSFDLILVGNGNTGTATALVVHEFVRNMAFGFTPLEMTAEGRWPGHTIHWQMQSGLDYFSNTFSVSGWPTQETSGAGRLHAHGWRTIFTRTNLMPIGPAHSYNVIQNPVHGNSVIITAGTRFDQAFFDANGGLQTRPDGSRYFRIYQQWGATLTFNTNHATLNAGVENMIRTADIAYGQSVNDTLLTATRHAQQPIRGDVWPGWAHHPITGGWQGSMGWPGVEGTRGGWPRNPTTASDISGGDWAHLYSVPAGMGLALYGWNTDPQGLSGTWVHAHTPIYHDKTIYAIWRPWISLRPGIPENSPFINEINMNPARNPYNDPGGVLHRYVTIGQPFPSPFPGDPIWPGRDFIGWFPEPSPEDLGGIQSLGPGAVVLVRPYYAVWRTDVIFNPNPPNNPLAGGRISNLVPGQTATVQHTIGRPIVEPVPHPGYSVVSRPGGWVHSGNWFALEPDPENPGEFIRRVYSPAGPRTVMQGMEVFAEWLGTVTFRPGHTRGRLDGLGQNVNVVRSVPEGSNLGQNPLNQRVPVTTSVTLPSWANDPGLNFGGWRKIDVNGIPLYPNGDPVAPGDPLPPLWSSAEVAAMEIVNVAYFFEAVWGLRLEFYKIGETINLENAFGYEPLPGARFILKREVPDLSGAGTTWEQVYPVLPAEYVLSGPDGRVLISAAFSEGLELHRIGNTYFRLVETLAPAGYRTPMGHWNIQVGQEAGMPLITAQVGNPSFFVADRFENGLPMRRLTVSNVGFFSFWKTNGAGDMLPGAVFRLFAFNGSGTPPAVLLTDDMIGFGLNQWSDAGVATSSSLAAMTFFIQPGRYYQLVETIPPQGYQMPMGQWRIRVNSANPPTTLAANLTITLIGDVPMPGIFPHPTYRRTYLIYNWPNFDLPLTGGRGINIFVMTGFVMVFIAICSGAVVIVRRRRKGLSRQF